MRLHTSVGPSGASIAAIAAEAGVTRLTVYRHFPDQDDLFAACMGLWADLHPLPDPSAWASLPRVPERAHRALTALYRWFAQAGADLDPIDRDAALLPAAAREQNAALAAGMVASIVGATVDAPEAKDPRRRALMATVGHVSSRATWRSLVIEQGLSTDAAVELAASWVALADRDGQPGDAPLPEDAQSRSTA